jgi:Protein of unknown function (DUF4235)
LAARPRWVAVVFALVATALARRPKVLYVPFGILAGRVASKLAGVIVKRLWTFLAGETEMPKAMEQQRGWAEVVVAATLGGAVVAGVKAFVDRAFATGFAHGTGLWPGKVTKPKM